MRAPSFFDDEADVAELRIVTMLSRSPDKESTAAGRAGAASKQSSKWCRPSYPKTKSELPYTTHVCAHRGAGALPPARMCSQRDVSNEKEWRSLNGERPLLPPKA